MSDLNDTVAQAIAQHLGKTKKVTTPVTAPRKPVEYVPLTEHQMMFSDVFGYTPTFGDFVVDVLDTSAIDDEVRMLIPKVDADYVVQKNEAALLVAGIQDGDKSLITGPTGSGKSSLVKYVCAKLNRPFIRINMSGDVESASLFGALTVSGGATVWQDGAITEAAKYGAVCLVDEWELMPAEIAMGMQNLLEDEGYLYLKEMPATSKERTVIPHKEFRLVFAGNTVGQGDTSGAFSGVGIQNTATIDRFTNTLRLGYLSMSHEVNIITSKTSVDSSLANQMVRLAGHIRNAYDSGKIGLTMSPRTLINWARKTSRYSVRDAFRVSFGEKLNVDDERSVQEMYVKVFGE